MNDDIDHEINLSDFVSNEQSNNNDKNNNNDNSSSNSSMRSQTEIDQINGICELFTMFFADKSNLICVHIFWSRRQFTQKLEEPLFTVP